MKLQTYRGPHYTLPTILMETYTKCSLAKLMIMDPNFGLDNLIHRRDTNNATRGRNSFSGVESSAAEATAALLGVRLMAAEMPQFMQVHAFRCARKAYDGLDKFSSRKIAHDVKKEFDKVYGPAWHCIVGMSFGSFVTHSRGCFVYFSMEKVIVMLFKTGVRTKNS